MRRDIQHAAHFAETFQFLKNGRSGIGGRVRRGGRQGENAGGETNDKATHKVRDQWAIEGDGMLPG